VRTGLVLGGGGARGAYEAGVLRYVARAFPRARFDVVTGTSAGAINAAWVAAHAGVPGHAALDLAEIWAALRLEDVYRLTSGTLLRPLRSVFGSNAPVALADAAPLAELLDRVVPWSRLERAIDGGDLAALAITATELATSRNVVWVAGRPSDLRFWESTNPHIRPRPARIGPAHVLASAAIPLVFPPVEVDGAWFVDGGLGQQTPLRPALRLGVDRLLVISLRSAATIDDVCRIGDERAGEPPSWAQVVGKTMTSVLLDKSAHEVRRLERVNRVIEWGAEQFGGGFEQAYGELLARERGASLRPVRATIISPRSDLGALAVQHLDEHGLAPTSALHRLVLRTIARAGSAAENDLLSFLLFDPGFLARLVRLGEEDAESRHAELEAVFAAD